MNVRLDYATPPASPPGMRWRVAMGWVVVPILLGIGGFVGGRLLAPGPSYTSSGKYMVKTDAFPSPQSVAAAQKAHVAALTDPAFIGSIAARTGISPTTLAANLQVTPVASSKLIVVAYTAGNPKDAFNVVNAIFTTYPTNPAQSPGSSGPIAAVAFPIRGTVPVVAGAAKIIGLACGLLGVLLGCGLMLWWQLGVKRGRTKGGTN